MSQPSYVIGSPTEHTPLVQTQHGPREVIILYQTSTPSRCYTCTSRVAQFLASIAIGILIFFTMTILLAMIFAPPTATYHYFLFTRRWPPAVCHTQQSSCVKDSGRFQKWTIHGLWPEFSNNTWDQYCTDARFNMTLLEPLRATLLQQWPNLLAGHTAESLWEHEWRKHGTCSHLSQLDYFRKTLHLEEQYPLDQWLASAGIVPSETKGYSEHEWKAAVSPHISPEMMALNCERDHQKGWYLKEVMLCFEYTDAATPTPCTVESTCRNHPFRYLPPKPNNTD